MDAARARRYPLTHAALGALSEGEAVLAELATLEAAWQARRGGVARHGFSLAGGGPAAEATLDVDVALAGGGLSLLYAAYLARRGLRVAVVERRARPRVHREWNISEGELAPLVASGLFDATEVAGLIRRRYDHGVVRWHGGSSHPVRGVLDCAIDAEGLMTAVRERSLAAGVRFFEGHALLGYRRGPGGLALRLAAPSGGTDELTCALLLDGMGAASPHARFDLVCPTVGGVLAGLDEGPGPREVDGRVGEILASTEGVEAGRQHVWEGFPAPQGRYTTYLFHYAEPRTLGPEPLFSLYERFFATRPRYKTGEAILEKATYGLLPAHTRLRPFPTAPHDRVLLVGDAAGRHSPLTFCGFGSMIRSFRPVADGVLACFEAERFEARRLAGLWAEPAGLSVMGALALMMVGTRLRPGADPQAINALLDAAFGALAELGDEVYGAFVRDEIGCGAFVGFMRRVAARHPAVYREVLTRLTPAEAGAWSAQLLRFAWQQSPLGVPSPRRGRGSPAGG